MNTPNNNRFHLPRKGRKYNCPSCNGKKSFRRYIDGETGLELADECGICDHINSCGYHYPPRDLFRDRPELRPEPSRDDRHDGYTLNRDGRTPVLSHTARTNAGPAHASYADSYAPAPQTTFYPAEWPIKAKERRSTFRTWFEGLGFDTQLTQHVIDDYYLGATDYDIRVDGTNHGPAAIFWMIDEEQRVHDAKLIAYHPDGHRVAGWGNSVRSLCIKKHRGPQLDETEKVLFGLHLVPRYPDKVICIVESEKSALICACRYPDFLWLATGGCGNLQPEKLRPLLHRRLVVYPDSGAYDKWQHLMHQSGHRHYRVERFLEDYVPNTDIADLILGVAQRK